VAINLVAFAKFRGDLGGQVLVLFILAVAACEAAVALALVLMLYKRKKTLDVSVWQELREPDQEPIEDEIPLPPAPKEESFELLTPAGPAPPAKKEAQEVSHV
jgi:NADH-quinone oxidoreductase subunit K